MTQISQVADSNIIYMNDVDGIATMLLPSLIVMIGSDAGNKHITDLILARTLYHTWIPIHGHDIIMPRMIMADCDDGGADLTQLVQFSRCGALLRRERVGDNGNMLAT